MAGRRRVLFGFGVLALALAAAALGLPATFAAPVDVTFTVDSTLDGTDLNPGDHLCKTAANTCTLRAAVQEANAQAVTAPATHFNIVLSTAASPQTFFLSINGANEDNAASGDLDIKANISIYATLAPATIDAAALNDRVFQIPVLAALSLRNVTVQNGSGLNMGGGIRNAGLLTLTNTVVQSNTAHTSQAVGGGIFNAATGRPLVNQSVVRGNTSVAISPTAVVYAFGGGLYGIGPMVISGSQILSNTSIVTGTSVVYYGAGIFANGALTLTNSLVQGNRFRIHGSVSGTGGGAGVLAASTAVLEGDSFVDNDGIDMGGALLAVGPVTIRDSTFERNTASYGGAMYVYTATATVADSTFKFNHAPDGGAIFVNGGSGLRVARSTLYSNQSSGSGAGIFNQGALSLTNSTLFLNQASNDGGGLFNSGQATLNNDTVLVNFAQANGSLAGSAGGIYNGPGGLVYLRNSVLNNIDGGGEIPDCKGTIVSLDYNLVTNLAGCTLTGLTAHNQTGISPGLSFLADNGGPALTSLPNAQSPVIDAGDLAGCFDELNIPLATDQRGFPRRADGDRNGSARCDIGAVELQLSLYLPAILR